MRMKAVPPLLFGALIAVALSAVAVPVQADEEGDIKYRKAVMKAIGGNMGAMATIIQGQGGDAANLKTHAQAMADLAAIAPQIFPEGSDFGETSAKAEIWEKPDDFKKALDAFGAAAQAMAAAGGGTDMSAAAKAFKGLGGTCKGCHQTFREKN